MDFSRYQSLARSTAIYPNLDHNLYYPALGLCGEAGEVAEIIKKVYRDSNGAPTTAQLQNLRKELGDVLWYLSNLTSEIGFELDSIAEENIKKLSDRQNRNMLHGSGDSR